MLHFFRSSFYRFGTGHAASFGTNVSTRSSCFRKSISSRPFLNRPVFYTDKSNHGEDSTKKKISVRRKSTVAIEDSLTRVEFPSIVIGPNGHIEPQGSFAEAQAQFLDPDEDEVNVLSHSLDKANMGIVAHYYMDVELQGVLQAVGRKQAQEVNGLTQSNVAPDQIRNQDINSMNTRVAIADSLAMGDHAVRMCRDLGVNSIMCLGVDFMAESVAAILNRNGFGNIPVYRAQTSPIGCSLAESAERLAYRAWLESASRRSGSPVLHVVYINTSLETKAVSSSILPTITCTSSNVLKTLLQASAQIGPELQIYYGPDTYMGHNLIAMIDSMLTHEVFDKNGKKKVWDDSLIASELHPLHNRDSLQKLRDSINVFPHGNCVVHNMFGADVVQTVKEMYQDAYVTAHLEVPGEMFQIAMEKSLDDKGIVGSTSDILKFISRKVAEAATEENKHRGPTVGRKRRLKFILGTEAGMVTSIVKSVQGLLSERDCQRVEAEIVFPVASEAITAVDDHIDLAVVPGVSGGDGCSSAGGCATCPFMKMNDLDALNDVVSLEINPGRDSAAKLIKHRTQHPLKNRMLNGVKATDLGVEPIQYMRALMRENALPGELVHKIEASRL